MFGIKLSVDSIMKAHARTINKLERHSAAMDQKAAGLDERITKLMQERDGKLEESGRAARIAAKMKSIME